MTTMLDQILDFENVKAAWDHVRTSGKTPGVDDWGVRRFARHWEENLRSLMGEVRANSYRPSRLRVRYIPKKSGGKRRLGIMTVRDRVLQRASLQVLEWRFERKFLQCSYGYRPKRSMFKAVGAIVRYRDRGHGWLLDADIDNCFDSIDHAVLWPLIEQEVWEAPVLRLLEQWLAVGAVDSEARKGISQGMPISPLLCNVTLHEMDWRLAAAGAAGAGALRRRLHRAGAHRGAGLRVLWPGGALSGRPAAGAGTGQDARYQLRGRVRLSGRPFPGRQLQLYLGGQANRDQRRASPAALGAVGLLPARV